MIYDFGIHTTVIAVNYKGYQIWYTYRYDCELSEDLWIMEEDNFDANFTLIED